ncbi:uncharacterized protein LOC143373754 isoform X2 [Andrena cerasifolii]|uniref:uncharacterized protein LOC143373754 isoform X2 n=1 Tax=Andrena cerasifolii TaxID=2819439 RepID=UPI0040382D77
MKYIILCCTILAATFAQPPVQGVTPTNVLSSPDQHASFSFVRPGLTQTAFAFSGPSSHQSFTSNIGDVHLAQKVLPNIANALAYRNPGLGVFPGGLSAHSYATAPLVPPTFPSSFTFVPAPSTTRNVLNPALAYYQQLQQIQQPQPFDHHPAAAIYQPQLAQLVALRQAQAQSQANPQPTQTQQAPGGFEPPISCLLDRRFNQLSHGAI